MAVLLQVASMARSTFYYQCRALGRADKREGMRAEIRAIYAKHKGRYGYRRITVTLRRSSATPVNHKRDFHAVAPNEKWVTDITELNMRGQKLYLSASMDLYNGEIIAHRMAKRPVFELVVDTLRAASRRLGSGTMPILHSDQGWHYKMQPYRAMLDTLGITQSMSRKGNGFDNAAIESFFGTLKAEFFHLTKFDSVAQLEAGVHDYIRYYNCERIKLRLRGLSPVEYRLKNIV